MMRADLRALDELFAGTAEEEKQKKTAGAPLMAWRFPHASPLSPRPPLELGLRRSRERAHCPMGRLLTRRRPLPVLAGTDAPAHHNAVKRLATAGGRFICGSARSQEQCGPEGA